MPDCLYCGVDWDQHSFSRKEWCTARLIRAKAQSKYIKAARRRTNESLTTKEINRLLKVDGKDTRSFFKEREQYSSIDEREEP